MVLRIIVLVKQVPDTHNVTSNAMKEDGTINRAALPSIFNPEDLHALEAALKIKETLGAIVTTVSLGPPAAAKVLQECLYRGADDAILVSDPKFAASDTLATSYALSCAIKKVGKYDLVLCGRQAIDGDTAQVGPQIAEKLGLNQLTCVGEVIKVTAKEITVRRITDDGHEILTSKLPALVTILAQANEARFPHVKKVLQYKNIACQCQTAYIHPECDSACNFIKQWNASDINADPALCGLTGSPTKVKSIHNVVLKAHDAQMLTNSAADINKLMHELISEHVFG